MFSAVPKTTEEDQTHVKVTASLLFEEQVVLRCFSVLQSRDGEHRKSAGKQGLDSSGNLYQYDNYDEVAMDTDSETSSPGESYFNTN